MARDVCPTCGGTGVVEPELIELDAREFFGGTLYRKPKWRTLKKNVTINQVTHTKGTRYKVYGTPEVGWIVFDGYSEDRRIVKFQKPKG